MRESMLEKGGGGLGVASRSYDKYGKRMMTATPKKDRSMKDKSMAAPRKAGTATGVGVATPRTDVGI